MCAKSEKPLGYLRQARSVAGTPPGWEKAGVQPRLAELRIVKEREESDRRALKDPTKALRAGLLSAGSNFARTVTHVLKIELHA